MRGGFKKGWWVGVGRRLAPDGGWTGMSILGVSGHQQSEKEAPS